MLIRQAKRFAITSTIAHYLARLDRYLGRAAAALAFCVFTSGLTSAHDYTGLSIDGAYQPSQLSTFPVTTDYAWLWYQFAGGGRLSWFYGPGTDGGIIFDKAQTHPPYNLDGTGTLYHDPGELGGEFLFLNQPSVLYSANTGISINAANTIDMSNLSLFRGAVEDNIGVSLEGNSLVPLVADITALVEGESGWQIYPDGRYDLFFHTSWGGVPLGIHFTGQTVAAQPPLVSGFWSGNSEPGAFVFVFGANFEIGSTQVSIGGVNAPATQVVTPDMLIFILPDGVPTGLISVTTPHGDAESGALFGGITTGLGISGVWPGAGASPGDFVFVFGSGFTNPVGITIGGVNAPIAQAVNDRMAIFIVPDNAISGLINITVGNESISTLSEYTVLP